MASQAEIEAAEQQIIEGNKGAILAVAILRAESKTTFGSIDHGNYNHWKTLQLNAHALRRSLDTLIETMDATNGIGKMHTA